MKKLFFILCLSISFLNLHCALGIDKEIKCNTSKISVQDKVNIVLGIYFYLLRKECAFDKDKENKTLLSFAYKSAFGAIEDNDIKVELQSSLIPSNLEVLINLAKKIYNELDEKLRAEKFGEVNIRLFEFLKQSDALPES